MRNKTEQRGFLWLSVLLLVLLVVLLLVPHKSKTVQCDDETSEALSQLEATSGRPDESHNNRGGRTHRRKEGGSGVREEVQRFEQPDFAKRERKDVTVELNSADTLDLQDLRGIGPYFARAIVKYRDILGGYVKKEQLLEVYGMTQDRYDAIAPHITLNTCEIKKIQINSASYAELRRHPYIDKYVARAIVRLREAGQQFRNVDDLLKISIIEDETRLKIAPYLDFGMPECNEKQITDNDTIHSGSDGPDA